QIQFIPTSDIGRAYSLAKLALILRRADAGLGHYNFALAQYGSLTGQPHRPRQDRLAALRSQRLALAAAHFGQELSAGRHLGEAGGADTLAAARRGPVVAEAPGGPHEGLADRHLELMAFRLNDHSGHS